MTKHLTKHILILIGIGIFTEYNLRCAEGILDNAKSFYALSANNISGELISMNTFKEKKGGIISKESFIHISNLKLIDEKIKNKKTEAKK